MNRSTSLSLTFSVVTALSLAACGGPGRPLATVQLEGADTPPGPLVVGAYSGSSPVNGKNLKRQTIAVFSGTTTLHCGDRDPAAALFSADVYGNDALPLDAGTYPAVNEPRSLGPNSVFFIDPPDDAGTRYVGGSGAVVITESTQDLVKGSLVSNHPLPDGGTATLTSTFAAPVCD